MVNKSNLEFCGEKLQLTPTEEGRGLYLLNRIYENLLDEARSIHSIIKSTSITFFEKPPLLSSGINSEELPYVVPIEIFMALPYDDRESEVISGSILSFYNRRRGEIGRKAQQGKLVGLFSYIDEQGSSEASVTNNSRHIHSVPLEDMVRSFVRRSNT